MLSLEVLCHQIPAVRHAAYKISNVLVCSWERAYLAALRSAILIFLPLAFRHVRGGMCGCVGA